MKKNIFFKILFLIPFLLFSQDKLIDFEGNSTEVKVLEINETEIKYKKSSNTEGPLYTINRDKVYEIHFSNGEIEKINNKVVEVDNSYKELEENNLDLIFSKGNKVFIENVNLAKPKAIMYLKEHLVKWGYWEVTDNEYEADFVIEYHFSKKAMADKGARIVLKTRNGVIYKESEEYLAKGRHQHGFNPSSWVANKIVEQYLKEIFK